MAQLCIAASHHTSRPVSWRLDLRTDEV